MNVNETLLNQEVMETTEDLVAISFKKGYMMGAGTGLAVFGAVIAYKYVIRPIRTKLNTKKSSQQIEVGETDQEESNESSSYTTNEIGFKVSCKK